MIKLKAISTAVLALFVVNSGIADQNAATEQITSAAWTEALENAARLSSDLLHVEDARPVEITHLPIQEIYNLTGCTPTPAPMIARPAYCIAGTIGRG